MNKIHNTLIKQLKKSGLDELLDSDDDRYRKLFDYITSGYVEFEGHIDRLENTLEVSLNKSFELINRIELNAKKSQKDFALLVNGMPGYITWFDKNFTYLGVNQNFLNLTGGKEDDYIGKRIEGIQNLDATKLMKSFADFCESSLTHSDGEFKITIKDQDFFIFTNFQKIDDGNIIIIASLDMTEKIQMQEVINKQTELTIRNSKLVAIGEMAAGVAHEINNPLMVIIGNTGQLLRGLSSQDVGTEIALEFYEKLDKIHRMSTRINKIVKSLKYISRDGPNDPFVETKIKEIIDNSLELCYENLKTNQVVLTIEGDLQKTISCQAISISQVFVNLINNSIDAIYEIDKPWIKIILEDDENEIRIKFIDCGKGIHLEVQDKLFQPFFTTKEIGKGTGLGLSISKAIIEDHNGRFYIDNDCENTCFVIAFSKFRT